MNKFQIFNTLKNIFCSCICALGLTKMYEMTQSEKNKVKILVYHDFGNELEFKKHLDFFSGKGEITNLDKVLKLFKDKNDFNRKYVITFDDGYRCNNFLLNIKGKYSFLIFIPTYYIENEEPFWWDKFYGLNRGGPKSRELYAYVHNKLTNCSQDKRQLFESRITSYLSNKIDIPKLIKYGQKEKLDWDEIRNLSSKGIEFGAHSHKHFVLTQLDHKNILKDILKNRKIIAKELGKDNIHFAYPGGYYNDNIADLVAEANFSSAVTTDYGTNTFDSDVFKLKRIGIDKRDWISTVIVKESELWGEIMNFFKKRFLVKFN